MVWSWLVNWSWMVDWGFVNGSWMIDRGWFVYYWSGMINGSRLMNRSWGSISFIGYICDVTSVMISLIIHILTSTIGKQYRVMSVDVTAIRILSSFEICSGVLIAYAIGIMVWSWLIYRFMIGWSWFIRWNRSMVDWCWSMIRRWTSWSCRCSSKKN